MSSTTKQASPLFLRTVALIEQIPKGKVLTYGKVAELIGAPGCARHVSYILSSSSKKHKLPWQRVLSSSGKIPSHASWPKQVRLLEKEGIEIEGRAIDLDEYQWTPKKRDINSILKGIPKHVSIYSRSNS